MTEKILDWLNHNRFRAYPLVNDKRLLCGGERIPDCVILDCLVMDTRHGKEDARLVFTHISVGDGETVVSFTYDGMPYSCTLEAGQGVSDDNIVTVGAEVVGSSAEELLYIKLVFSSHDYILEHAGKGEWSFSGEALRSKVVSVAASGVMGLKTGGSSHVEGYEQAGTATGVVHLVDGYRTQPVIQNGSVVVKVGTRYGEDPCHYREDDPEYLDELRNKTDCGELMFFFCGQNAVDSGDVAISGGPGVVVKHGGQYEATRDVVDTYGNVGLAAGERIPCIEVIADKGLLRLYRPSRT